MARNGLKESQETALFHLNNEITSNPGCKVYPCKGAIHCVAALDASSYLMHHFGLQRLAEAAQDIKLAEKLFGETLETLTNLADCPQREIIYPLIAHTLGHFPEDLQR